MGLVMESVNSPRSTAGPKGPEVTIYPVLFSWWVSILSMAPLVTIMATVDDLSFMSTFSWFVFGTYVLYFVYINLVQVGYYMYLSNPTSTATWPYKRGFGAASNFMRYDFMMGFVASIFRLIVVFLAMGVALQDSHWSNTKSETLVFSLAACGHNKNVTFASSCHYPVTKMLDSSGVPVMNTVSLPLCSPNNFPSRRSLSVRRLAVGLETGYGTSQYGIDLGLKWVKDNFKWTPSPSNSSVPLYEDCDMEAYCTIGSSIPVMTSKCIIGEVPVPAYIITTEHRNHAGKDNGYGTYSLAGQMGYYAELPDASGVSQNNGN